MTRDQLNAAIPKLIELTERELKQAQTFEFAQSSSWTVSMAASKIFSGLAEVLIAVREGTPDA